MIFCVMVYNIFADREERGEKEREIEREREISIERDIATVHGRDILIEIEIERCLYRERYSDSARERHTNRDREMSV